MKDFIHSILYQPDGERRIWWHWQNLNEDGDGHIKGPGWRYGRAHLYVGGTGRNGVGVEWRLPSSTFHLGFEIDTDDDDLLKWTLCIPPVGLHFGVESWPLSRWVLRTVDRLGLRAERDSKYAWSRKVSIRVFDWAAWWTLWWDDSSWTSGDSRLRAGNWHPFGHPGERLGQAREVERRVVHVAMPERSYSAVATRNVTVTRGTSRWPFSRPWVSLVNLDFAPYAPVPVPGKGENSWDCGEDAISASSGGGDSIDAAVAKFVKDTLAQRERRGGKNWVPEAMREKSA